MNVRRRGRGKNMRVLLLLRTIDLMELRSSVVAVLSTHDAYAALFEFALLSRAHTRSVLFLVPVFALGYLSGVIAAHRITASSPDTDLPTVAGLRVSVFWLQQTCVCVCVCLCS